MTSRTGGLINCWRGLIVWNPFICKFDQDPSFCGGHPLSSSTIDSPIPVACISPSSPRLRSLTSAPTYSTAPSRRTSTMALFGPAPHVVPRGTVPGAWWWPAFSHRALGPMPLAACAERGVRWSGSQLKNGSGDGEGLPGGGAFRLCLNNDKIIGFTLQDGAAKGRGAFGSSTIPEGASTTKSN